jgi:hypothetical protein
MKTTSKVIIAGYPKSGNTWLTRLAAEIIDCPVAGFLNEPSNREISIEGSSRASGSECYKAHHSYLDLERLLGAEMKQSKIIYIYRDPRDVVVSASKFFKVPIPRYEHWLRRRVPLIASYLGKLPGFRGYERAPQDYFADGLLYGCSANVWLRCPWREHVEGYLGNPMILLIKYEDLIECPLVAARLICNHLGIDRTDAHLMRCIKNQSFDNRKSEFVRSGEVGKAKFMRQGGSGGWRASLTARQIAKIEAELSETMLALGYLGANSSGHLSCDE